jgi:hypothetical protein
VDVFFLCSKDIKVKSEHDCSAPVWLLRLGNEVQTSTVALNQLLWDQKAHTDLIKSQVVIEMSLMKVKYFILVLLLNADSQIVDQAD